MMILNAAIILLFLLLPTEGGYDWYPGYQYSAINHTRPGHQRFCAYHGYTPAGAPKFDIEESKTAYLQTDVLNVLWTETSTPIAFALVDAPDAAHNAGQTFREWTNTQRDISYDGRAVTMKNPGRVASWLQKHNKQLRVLNKVSKLFKFAAIISPAAGIISAIIGGIAGVGSPTPEDILKETNKAINKLSDEVDRKLETLRGYVDSKIIDLEKDLNQRKYKFLFKYWTMCVTGEKEELVNRCQRQAYTLILASEDEFLLYHDRMDTDVEGKRKIPENKLTMEERRKIEVGMMSFRNYALLSMTCMKTLMETYRRRKKEIANNNQKECEQLWEEQKDKEASDTRPISDSDSDLLSFCMFREKLTVKTVYYEIYGFAAIQEIKEVASYRLSVDPEFGEPEEVFSRGPWRLGPIYWEEKRVRCKAYVHPRIKDPSEKCKFDVQLIERGESYSDYANNIIKVDVGGSWYHDDKDAYVKIGDELVKGIESEGSKAVQYCHNLIRLRRKEYNAMEQPDIDRYWNTAVMSLIRCGKLLSDGTVAVCLPSEMKDNFPEAYESRILLNGTTARWGRGRYDSTNHVLASTVVDGLANTYGEFRSGDPNHPEYSWPWSIEFTSPAYVMKVFVYFPSKVFEGERHLPGLEVKTKEKKDDAESQWVSCKDDRLPVDVYLPDGTTDFPYEFVVKCETPTPVEKIQVIADGRYILSNVLVEGYHPTPDPKDPCEFPMELERPQIKKGQQVDRHSPYAAVDGRLTSTMEIACDSDSDDPQVEITVGMKNTGVVSVVKIYFKGEHENVRIGIKQHDEQTYHCGEEEVARVTSRFTEPFTAQCDTAGKEATLSLSIKSDKFLKIREIQVKGEKVGSGSECDSGSGSGSDSDSDSDSDN